MFLLRRREAAHHQGEDDSRGHMRQLWQHSEPLQHIQREARPAARELWAAMVTSIRMVEGCAPECVISARSALHFECKTAECICVTVGGITANYCVSSIS